VSENGFDMSGRRVLISGAAGGIGTATARALASLGASLALTDASAMEAQAEALKAEGAEVITHQADITSRAEVAQLADAVGDVDAVVALAGICPNDDWAEDADWDAVFHQVMDVNVLGSLNLARVWLPKMAARGGGRMVLVGSIAGRSGGTSPIVQPHYVASKGGIHAVTRWLARRAAPDGVIVNAVAPGPVETAMTADVPYSRDAYPLGRIGRPEEIAWPIAFLCSAAASYTVGAVLDVNGGLHFS
jgi:3-oxoacyl-[acyl-carrier protein] reductase